MPTPDPAPTPKPPAKKRPVRPAITIRMGGKPVAVAPLAKTPLVALQDSGHIVVTGADGQRIEELEAHWPQLWAQHAQNCGYDPLQFTLAMSGGRKLQLIKNAGETDKSPPVLTWKIL